MKLLIFAVTTDILDSFHIVSATPFSPKIPGWFIIKIQSFLILCLRSITLTKIYNFEIDQFDFMLFLLKSPFLSSFDNYYQAPLLRDNLCFKSYLCKKTKRKLIRFKKKKKKILANIWFPLLSCFWDYFKPTLPFPKFRRFSWKIRSQKKIEKWVRQIPTPNLLL